MSRFNVPHGRGLQILSILTKYGPLSHRGIMQIIEPKIHKVRLSEALTRLLKRHLVTKRNDRVFRGTGVFYQINQNKKYWPEIIRKIKCSDKNLHQPQFRPVESLHSEACALWCYYFENILPEACVLRDYEISSSPIAMRMLIQIEGEVDLFPDLLLLLPNSNRDGFITIAVEIERYAKSALRTELKLKKYANESLLDGVIYICENEGVTRHVSEVFNKSVSSSAFRIKNYRDHFLLFKNNLFTHTSDLLILINGSSHEVYFHTWLDWLTVKNAECRKDHDLSVQ